jgi:hypothetical protein
MAPGSALLASRSCRPRLPSDPGCRKAFSVAAMRTVAATLGIATFTCPEALVATFQKIVECPRVCPPGYVAMLGLLATGT